MTDELKTRNAYPSAEANDSGSHTGGSIAIVELGPLGDLAACCMWIETSKKIVRAFKRELIVYKRVLCDERTPRTAKIFLALAVGYLSMPFDLIPDFIPVLGYVDDIIIVPVLVYTALRFVPPELVSEHRERVFHEHQ